MEDLEAFLAEWGEEVRQHPGGNSPIVQEMTRRLNVKHSSESARWFTPEHVIRLARNVLGRFDVDPASEAEANDTVQATRYITVDEDGLVAPWRLDGQDPVTVWLNPPGGKYLSTTGEPGKKGAGNRSLAGLFWQRLIRERDEGNIRDAIYLAFNLELLQTTQGKETPPIGRFLCCVPNKRIKFTRHDGHCASPTHGNAIVYVAGTDNRRDKFIEQFSSFGTIMEGV